jgi:hypothetical protein
LGMLIFAAVVPVMPCACLDGQRGGVQFGYRFAR